LQASHGEEKNIMNENRIQQVVEIEKQAQEIHETAIRDAQQLPVLADQEAQGIIEKARAEAQEEARQLLTKAQAGEETAKILAQAEEKNRQVEALAMSNFDRAVAYILERVAGRA
jgi:vacuolar-type H+-ATPase subunit H